MGKTITELNEIYKEAKDVDKDLRAEQRTNIQLVAGDQYMRYGSRYWNRVREAKQINPEQRLRLVRNHIGKITKIYRNEIQRHSPGVTIVPKNPSELQDQKAAELHNAVWQDTKSRHKLNKNIRTWIKDFVEIGEVATKIFWDPNAGTQIGWEPALDENGNPTFNPITGQMEQSENPVMSGDLVFETIHGFDFFRDPAAKSMMESPYVGYHKMCSIKDLKAKYKDDEDKLKFIQESSEDTFRVFETTSAVYKRKKDMALVREIFFKPCSEYRNGYYEIFTELGILEEGELPFGIFPIVYEGFDEITTSPRHYSIIKTLRPYQIEINRAASKVAETQITLGSDRVYVYSGSKPSSGVGKPGTRVETITGVGQEPKVVPGSVGEQYFQYIQDQILEMYKVADVAEEMEELPMQVDPYALLFRSLKQKKKFIIYSDKFESFLTEVCWTVLKLMKKYASPQMFIAAVGKNEQINIAEFKSADDLHWQIKCEPQSDDIESKLGKQLVLNNLIQYVGNQVDKDQLGKLIRLSPYLNEEKMLEDLTTEYDNSVNDILALDRGEMPPPVKYEDHKYQLKRLTNRTKQADYRFKHPFIQSLYDQKIAEHEQAVEQETQALQAAEAGFIPSGGYSVACDLYQPDPNNPQSSKRVRMPSEAVQWLIKKLEQQGSSQKELEGLPQGALTEMAQHMSAQPANPGPGMPNNGSPN